MKLSIFDLDGTLINSTNRPSLQTSIPYEWSIPDWEISRPETHTDTLLPVYDILVEANKVPNDLTCILTARKITHYDLTFFKEHNINVDRIFSNFDDHWESIYELKQHLFDNEIASWALIQWSKLVRQGAIELDEGLEFWMYEDNQMVIDNLRVDKMFDAKLINHEHFDRIRWNRKINERFEGFVDSVDTLHKTLKKANVL